MSEPSGHPGFAPLVNLFQGPDPRAIMESLVRDGLTVVRAYEEAGDQIFELNAGGGPITAFAEPAPTPCVVPYYNIPGSLDEMLAHVKQNGGTVTKGIESKIWGDDTFEILGIFDLRVVYAEPTKRRKLRHQKVRSAYHGGTYKKE